MPENEPIIRRELLVAKEVAAMLGVSRSRFYELLRKRPDFPKKVSLLPDGSLDRWRREDVEEFIRFLDEETDTEGGK
jgi:predicted DNA-binding transcriptional regulator AlpA